MRPARQEIIGDAMEMARQGAFAAGARVPAGRAGTDHCPQASDIPTIGIGSGADCDGQALVTQDMLGLFKEMSPRFLKVYADLATAIGECARPVPQ